MKQYKFKAEKTKTGYCAIGVVESTVCTTGKTKKELIKNLREALSIIGHKPKVKQITLE